MNAVKNWVEKAAPGLAEKVPFQPFSVNVFLAVGDRIELPDGY
jgi:hypothetical protein